MSSSDFPERRLAFLLKRVQHSFRTRVDDALRPLKLTAPQFAVLAAVDLDTGISNAELARLAFVAPPTMHGILANLERGGLLQRSPHSQNGRVLGISLTALGQNVYTEACSHVEEIEHLLADAVGDDSQGRFTETLLRCAESLEDK